VNKFVALELAAVVNLQALEVRSWNKKSKAMFHIRLTPSNKVLLNYSPTYHLLYMEDPSVMKNPMFALLSFILSLFVALPAFAGCCSGGGKCMTFMVGGTLVWLVVASMFLFYAWNTVVSVLFHVKKVKYVQALLLVATMLVLCAPRLLMMNKMCQQMGCHDKASGEVNGEEEGEFPPMEEQEQ
jgi:hypothetical protein